MMSSQRKAKGAQMESRSLADVSLISEVEVFGGENCKRFPSGIVKNGTNNSLSGTRLVRKKPLRYSSALVFTDLLVAP